MSSQSNYFVHTLLRARDWQHRPEFDQVCDWWRKGAHGVCALVGIGGAGKTAIAERFLQELPGGFPSHPKVPKNQDLAHPTRLFVYSFYDAPNPDAFFADLAKWLRVPSDDAVTRGTGYHRILQYLRTAESCLIVLDGLERVQDDGLREGIFGQINDGRLRDLVLRVADGWLPRVSMLVTSRFRLYDPLASRTWYYKQIDIKQLEPAAAVRLLRDRGVESGTDEQLEKIARDHGFHAITVDLTGGYVAHFCDGDPSRMPPEPHARPASKADDLHDPHVAATLEQERKFARLTQRYHEALAVSDPAALALLQRVCLFRLGVHLNTLVAIFLRRHLLDLGKTEVSGCDLAKLSREQLEA